MNALMLFEVSERREVQRWVFAFLVIAALHAGLLTTIAFWQVKQTSQGTPFPSILVDLAPASASPEKQQQDLAPGLPMQQSDAAVATPEQQKPIERTIAPTPPQQNPLVAMPPEPAIKLIPQAIKPVTPRHARNALKKSSQTPPAPKTAAAPKAERQAPSANVAASGATAAAAAASYGAILAAHLQRFKQYPAPSRSAGEQGSAILNFTVNRHGQVLGSRIAQSSGHAALDAETLAVLHRAQPLPSFPPEMRAPSMTFNQRMDYSLH